MTEDAGDHGVSITETDLPGKRIITELIAGQVVDQYSQRAPLAALSLKQGRGASGRGSTGITIGEALEVTAVTAGQKPVEWSDAAAIHSAEVRATAAPALSPAGLPRLL